mgnify:FL=1
MQQYEHYVWCFSIYTAILIVVTIQLLITAARRPQEQGPNRLRNFARLIAIFTIIKSLCTAAKNCIIIHDIICTSHLMSSFGTMMSNLTLTKNYTYMEMILLCIVEAIMTIYLNHGPRTKE